MRTGHFTIKRIRVAGPFPSWTYRVSGWLRGRRIRKQFMSEAEACGAKARYEIDAANSITAALNQINTPLAVAQVREAEAVYHRLGKRSHTFAVDWFLEHYRPPVVVKALSDAVLAFRDDRAPRVPVQTSPCKCSSDSCVWPSLCGCRPPASCRTTSRRTLATMPFPANRRETQRSLTSAH